MLSEVNKVSGYEANIQKSIVFLYSHNSAQLENGVKNKFYQSGTVAQPKITFMAFFSDYKMNRFIDVNNNH